MPHISEDSAKVCKRSSPAEENGRGAVRWDMIGKDLGEAFPRSAWKGTLLGHFWGVRGTSALKAVWRGEREKPPYYYSNAFFSLRAMAVRLSCAEERMLAVPHS